MASRTIIAANQFFPNFSLDDLWPLELSRAYLAEFATGRNSKKAHYPIAKAFDRLISSRA
jgi:hypothetical protein